MEFERLSRRELQALCKRNKIPANITNVAMVDALKALSFVEGIGEFMQPSQSETAQSSIESPEGKEVTSPRLPPTGGRTTGRRNVAKEEPGTLQPTTRTRRSSRTTLAKDPDEAKDNTTETPSVVQVTRRAPLASVCRKMESQLLECEEEEKKNALVTPTPAGVTSRRRRGVKEESVVKREYSTRRSARLIEKKVEVPNEVEKEKSILFKSEPFTKYGEDVKMNFEESLDNVDETSGIKGIDTNTIVEQNPGERNESEVFSATKHHMQIGEQSNLAITLESLEGKDESEDVVPAQQGTTIEEESDQKSEVDGLKLDGEKVLLKSTAVDASTNMEGKDELEVVSVEECEMNEVKDPDEEVCSDFEIEAGVDEDAINEVQERSLDAYTYETETPADIAEHMDTSIETGIKDNACDTLENFVLETEDKTAADISADFEICNEIEKDICESHDMDSEDVLDFNMNEEILEINADVHLNVCEKELNLDESSKPIIVEANDMFEAKTTPTLKRMMTNLSDNKENFGSGKNVVVVAALTKETVKIAKNTAEKLEDKSVRKLSKMLKEKLQISSNKLHKNENANEARERRPALQALPENRLADETQN